MMKPGWNMEGWGSKHGGDVDIKQSNIQSAPGFTFAYTGTTVASNHLQGPHRESPKAMSKLSDTLIDGHLGQRRYQSRKNDLI